MNELSRETLDLVAAARLDWEPDDGARTRVRAGVLARVGIAAAAGTTLAGATSATAAAGIKVGSGVAAKLLVSVAIVGSIGTAGYFASTRSSRPRKPATTMASQPERRPQRPSTALERTAPVVPPEPRAAEAVATSPTHRVDPPPSRARKPTSSMRQQLGLLRAAMRALELADPQAALTRAAEYDERFPDGALQPEIAAVLIDALCALGRDREARARAERFFAAWPESPLVDRVRATCGGGGNR